MTKTTYLAICPHSHRRHPTYGAIAYCPPYISALWMIITLGTYAMGSNVLNSNTPLKMGT